MAHRTVAEWESHLGEQIRRARLAQNLSQERVAHLADVSVSSLRALEHGDGSSLGTLVKVARALGRQDWLDTFSPDVTVSPMAMLEQRRSGSPRTRQRASPTE